MHFDTEWNLHICEKRRSVLDIRQQRRSHKFLHTLCTKTKALHALHVLFLFLYISLSLSANLRRKHVTLNYCVSTREWNLHTGICVQPWSVNVFFFFCACLFFKRDSFPDNCDDWTNENVSFGARQTMNFHWSNRHSCLGNCLVWKINMHKKKTFTLHGCKQFFGRPNKLDLTERKW